MKPFKILTGFLGVFFLLFFLSFLFPEEGVNINGVRVDFISLKDFFRPDSSRKDISHIILYNKELVDAIDSISLLQSKDALDTAWNVEGASVDSLKKHIQPIEFHKENTSLYPFFKALKNTSKRRELIRILHYGDSQIESDRISSYLRNRFQQQFGGYGIGLFPAVLHPHSFIQFNVELSGDWKGYTIHDYYDSLIFHNRFGMLGTYASYGRPPDTTARNTEVTYEEWIKLSATQLSYGRSRYYDCIRMIYGHTKDTVKVELTTGDSLLDHTFLKPVSGVRSHTFTVKKSPEEFQLTFKGKDPPEIYGLALDPFTGVMVDNIPLRGSRGLEFTQMDKTVFHRMLKLFNVKLVLLQFGVNVVPNNAKSYAYYEDGLYEQLMFFKKVKPDLGIIVIGISDMSKKEKTRYVSYPSIIKIRNAQKNAAMRANCGFWDTYEAMGGGNSMPEWVYAKPALAQKDFTHFTSYGAKIIAEMFYNSLMHEYNSYVNQLNEGPALTE